MQTKKRDRLGRAHSNGYKAGLTGEWLGGWRDALTDKNLGLFKL